MVEANRSIQPTTWEYGTVTQTASTALRAPPEARRTDGSVPETRELVVQLQQRDRRPRHLQRGDVRPDQVAGDLDPAAFEELVELVVDDVELDRRGPSHAVHEGEHLVAFGKREVVDDRRRQSLDDLARRGQLPPLSARLSVDADADLHLVVAELERRFACRRHD